MATSCVKSVTEWLNDIDPMLDRYVGDFVRLDFTNTNSIKYFTFVDFALFYVPVSAAHRCMIINSVAKLQTPKSKLGLENMPLQTNETMQPYDRTLQPKQLNFGDETDLGNNGLDENDVGKKVSILINRLQR